MSAPCFTTRGPRPERHAAFTRSPRIIQRGGQPASQRYGERFKSLPVEGSAAFERARRPILSLWRKR
jgi:hypothetical protein